MIAGQTISVKPTYVANRRQPFRQVVGRSLLGIAVECDERRREHRRHALPPGRAQPTVAVGNASRHLRVMLSEASAVVRALAAGSGAKWHRGGGWAAALGVWI